MVRVCQISPAETRKESRHFTAGAGQTIHPARSVAGTTIFVFLTSMSNEMRSHLDVYVSPMPASDRFSCFFLAATAKVVKIDKSGFFNTLAKNEPDPIFFNKITRICTTPEAGASCFIACRPEPGPWHRSSKHHFVIFLDRYHFVLKFLKRVTFVHYHTKCIY